MSVEVQFESLPSFDPLYRASSASEAIAKAGEMIQEGSYSDQVILLASDEFQQAVNSALFNKDQRRNIYAEQIVNSFDEELQPLAQKVFIGK